MDCSPRLQPVDIGPVRIDDPVILAPMSGVTDMPFRQMVKRGGAGLVVSEMIASAAMVRENRKTLLMAKNSPEEFPMSVQLAGCEPEVMADAAKLNEDRGAAIIDINFGCPVKKVVNGHAGSSLMRDEVHAAKILEATCTIDDRVLCIFGGLHLVLTKEPEIQRIAWALRDQWQVERIAPGHCTGEPGFAALQEVFGENYLFAGLGESVQLP